MNNSELFDIIRHPTQGADWTYHGLGMIRLGLGDNRRMNIWDSRLVSVGVSQAHTHVWDFKSTVLLGSLTNHIYEEVAHKDVLAKAQYTQQIYAYNKIEVGCGPEGGGWGRQSECWLMAPWIDPAVYGPGHTYKMKAHEIHSTEFQDGTVTVIERSEPCVDHALVYWPRHDPLGSAMPRPARDWEVMMVCEGVCEKWGL
jgi:hypothetical protein